MKKNLLLQLFLVATIFTMICGCSEKKVDKATASAADNTAYQSLPDDSSDVENNTNELPEIKFELNDEVENTAYEHDPLNDISLTPDGDNSGKRVVCFGDSLTEGTGGDGVTMPGTVADLSGATVLNYGGYGESSSCIAARQGGNPQELVEDIVIPADCTPVRAQCSGNYGYEMLLVFGDAGINNAFLGGIEGTYSLVDDERCFTRLTPGDEVTLPEGTQLFTHAMLDKKDDDILVIWAGSNDGIEELDEIPGLVQRINEMIAYQGNDQYVVVSLTSRHARIPLVDDINKALSDEFGEHFLDFRSFIVNDALDQLGITPTDMDKKAIEIGDVPYSLRLSLDEEENHGNPDFYRLAGEQVYKKLKSLGYLY